MSVRHRYALRLRIARTLEQVQNGKLSPAKANRIIYAASCQLSRVENQELRDNNEALQNAVLTQNRAIFAGLGLVDTLKLA